MAKIKHYSISINEAGRVLNEYLRSDFTWKGLKQPGGGYSGGDAIVQNEYEGIAVVTRYDSIYYMVFIMPDGFISTARFKTGG